eukprot:TRINITY_DN17217_c0_g1_i1.p1 TRINITY_DN17217_c0_g1~~TRINITY_DN17217_c0_g1_i1.p1  ORF type:complete len:128 (+),score=2.15 TRINITY_DN17217_c0_g1_i1:239-622(+)
MSGQIVKRSSSITQILPKCGPSSLVHASKNLKIHQTRSFSAWDSTYQNYKDNVRWEPRVHPYNYAFWFGVVFIGTTLVGFPLWKELESNHTTTVAHSRKMKPESSAITTISLLPKRHGAGAHDDHDE